MSTLYHQNKTQISFWCRRRLNHKSLIQQSETLLVELTGTHAPSKTLGPLQLTIIQPKKLNKNNKNIHNVDCILAKKNYSITKKLCVIEEVKTKFFTIIVN